MNTLILNRDTFEMPADGWYPPSPPSPKATADMSDRGGSVLILNRDSFDLPEDGWYQVAPLGEFPHRPSGVVQVVDKAACDAMANAFRREAGKPNFAGLLIDFDHFSLDDKLKSEAAGWITELENRDTGLWAKIRWSDVGEECVKGGRYRFLSPVWSQRDCEDLGNGRLRPVKLLNAAVTNDPNLKGMVPLSNRDGAPDAGNKRLKWTLGDSPDGRHCPSCQALAGQVHTNEEWDAAGIAPGGDNLYCQGNCHCSLVETDEPVTGKLSSTPTKKDDAIADRESADDALANVGWTRLRPDAEASGATAWHADEALANVGWTDEARAASLAVRQAKAAARRAGREREGDTSGGTSPAGESGDSEMTDAEYDLERTTEAMETYRRAAEQAFLNEYGYLPSTPEEIAEGEDLADIPERYRTNGEMSPEELAEELLSESDQDNEDDPYASDFLGWFEDQGFASMSPEAVEGLTEQIREKLEAGETLDEGEAGFLEALSDSGYGGESEGDPIFQWQEQQSMGEAEEAIRSDEQPAETPHERAEDLMERVRRGEKLSAEDQRWLDSYRNLYGIDDPGAYRNGAVPGGFLANIGWTDEARAAALEVRRAKAAARAAGKIEAEDYGDVPRELPPRDEEESEEPEQPPPWQNGPPWPGWRVRFDEKTGRYVLEPINAPWRPLPGFNFPFIPPFPGGGVPIRPGGPYPIGAPQPRIDGSPQEAVDREKLERRRFARIPGR